MMKMAAMLEIQKAARRYRSAATIVSRERRRHKTIPTAFGIKKSAKTAVATVGERPARTAAEIASHSVLPICEPNQAPAFHPAGVLGMSLRAHMLAPGRLVIVRQKT